MAQPHDGQRPAGRGWYETGPIFADPTGQRRRLLRVVGAAASVLLVGALIVAGIGLFGGPNTPFSVFGAPPANGKGHPGGDGDRAPASGAASNPGPSRSATPSPSGSGSHSRSPRASRSPSQTNKAGNTPPGLSRSKKPHPSPSPHSP
ncbi:MAG: hypothetical protein LBV34_08295 [Nocardiopsaceae bacterium]|nr:hypothetical protein [Nocardiopsaceae bacterium]